MSENETLLERIDSLTKENNRLLELITKQNNAHHDYKTRVCFSNHKRLMEIQDLKNKNKSLLEKVDKEYNECILEKKKLMDEIEHIKKILLDFIDEQKDEQSKKRQRIECI
jgi:hypothetical protein